MNTYDLIDLMEEMEKRKATSKKDVKKWPISKEKIINNPSASLNWYINAYVTNKKVSCHLCTDKFLINLYYFSLFKI